MDAIWATGSGPIGEPVWVTGSFADVTPPVMTGTVDITDINTTFYTVSWSAASDNVSILGYEVSVNGGVSYIDVGNVLTTLITGRTPGSVDTVWVRAYDAAGNNSNILTTTATLIQTVTVADIIENLSGSVWKGQTIKYTWIRSGRIGSMNSLIIDGEAISDSVTGRLTINNLPTGTGVLLMSVPGSVYTDDRIAYQSLTPTVV